MRLSEAIRLGAMLHPQVYMYDRQKDRSGLVIGTCALGAATEAGYGAPDGIAWRVLGMPAACPACAIDSLNELGDLIVHLNDWHQWTREAIADWVATVEPADDRSEHSRAADAVREDVEATTV